MLKRLVRATVRRALGWKRVRWLVEAELANRRPRPKSELPDPALIDRSFVDRAGAVHPLDPALRNRLKPQWRTMLDPEAMAKPPSDEALADRARTAEKRAAEARALVATLGGRPLAGRILEVGCYDGSIAFQLARLAGTEIVASDLARYYLVQRPGAAVDTDLERQQAILAEIRARAGSAARARPGSEVGPVSFIEDDITASNLEPASFDAVLSFEVLEHVADPTAAFRAMAGLLKPGGIAYHDYNPFFSVNGGHSLCTLDFPWGHARLDRADFERYLREIRPAEADQALRFYLESLNRLSLVGLRTAIAAAGLELLALIPWTDRALAVQIQPAVLGQVQALYPGTTVDDLLATFVIVVARRPAAAERP